jgi:thioredoxin 1
MAVTILDDSNFQETLSKTPFAVVDFYASWCGPCIMFKPKFARISKDYPEAQFFMLDGERAPEARKTVTINELPFFGVYRDGVLVEGKSMSHEPAFREFIESHGAVRVQS